MFGFIRTIMGHFTEVKNIGTFQHINLLMCLCDGSDEPKHVAHCCVALKCCVWRYTSFVFRL